MSYKPLAPYKRDFGGGTFMLLPAHIGRMQFVLRNIGSTDMYISTHQNGLTNNDFGMVIKAGEVIQMRKNDFDDTESVWYIYAGSGGEMAVIA